MIDIILMGVVAFLYYIAQPVSVEKLVNIPQGSIAKIIAHLQREKIEVGTLDKYFIRVFGRPQSGWIEFDANILTKGDLFYQLCHAKAAVKTVTLVPGETNHFFFELLAQEFSLNASIIKALYEEHTPMIDGYLVPESYNIPIGIKEADLVAFLLDFAHKKHEKLSVKLLGHYDQKEWFNYLKIASVIQKEAANSEEMPLVASVIYNRLAKGMRLQMDGTLNYGIYSHQKVTPKRIREDRSSYNTYKYKGVPAQAVCMVSTEAINAAINPSETDYLYFMKNKKGTHDFARYYSTHIKNIVNGKK